MNILKRLMLKSPPFFNTIAWIGGILAAVGAAITTDVVIELPDIVNQIAGYCVVAGAVMLAIAKFTIENVKDDT